MKWPHWMECDYSQWSKPRLAEVTNWGKEETAEVQTRTCNTCGKVQVRRVSFGT